MFSSTRRRRIVIAVGVSFLILIPLGLWRTKVWLKENDFSSGLQAACLMLHGFRKYHGRLPQDYEVAADSEWENRPECRTNSWRMEFGPYLGSELALRDREKSWCDPIYASHRQLKPRPFCFGETNHATLLKVPAPRHLPEEAPGVRAAPVAFIECYRIHVLWCEAGDFEWEWLDGVQEMKNALQLPAARPNRFVVIFDDIVCWELRGNVSTERFADAAEQSSCDEARQLLDPFRIRQIYPTK